MSKKQKDASKFEGNGISYRAKMIGVEDVAEARGDEMCQESLVKLKDQVKASGQHKQRIFINVTLEGLRIVDTATMDVLHTHPVHQISFISRDVTDNRAFGYIYSAGDGAHKFFGIKTANAAENLVMCLRDLFQTVYEMKKKEIEEAKAKAAADTEEGQGEANNNEGSNNQAPEGQESIYQVPKSNAPVNPQEQNLLDLEDQVETILKGIEQIKNLEFDELTTSEAPRQPTSPTSPAPTPVVTDPWGMTAPAPAPASPLSNLQQLSSSPQPVVSSPFGGGMQAFPGSPAVAMTAAPGFGAGVQSAPIMMAMPGQQMMGAMAYGAPAYGQQPGFGAPFVHPMRSPVPGQPGFPGASPAFNPFGMASPAAGGMPMMPPNQQAVAAAADPFQNPPQNLLQPMKPGGGGEAPGKQAPPSPTRGQLFDDLVAIKKSPGVDMSTKSPKEMFKELNQQPKKSLNQIRTGGGPSATQS